MKLVHQVSYALMWIGGINWGLVGLIDYNAVDTFLGVGTTLARAIYVLVGLATLYTLFTHKSYCKICSGEMK